MDFLVWECGRFEGLEVARRHCQLREAPHAAGVGYARRMARPEAFHRDQTGSGHSVLGH